jgi:hypothetical protein
MYKSPDSQPDPGSYVDLLNRVTKGARQAKLGEQILDLAQKTCEKELEKERVVLSGAEKKRLAQQVLKAILADI